VKKDLRNKSCEISLANCVPLVVTVVSSGVQISNVVQISRCGCLREYSGE